MNIFPNGELQMIRRPTFLTVDRLQTVLFFTGILNPPERVGRFARAYR